MTFIAAKLIFVFGVSTFCVSAQNDPIPSYLPESDPEPQKIFTVPELINSGQKAPEISLSFELPREEIPLPFYETQPSSILKAPIPAEELTAPKEQQWNPNNSPIYYYRDEPEEDPQTVQYPKKYIKELYEKDKPTSSSYKNLDLPQIEKILYSLSKKENRASLQQEKVTATKPTNQQPKLKLKPKPSKRQPLSDGEDGIKPLVRDSSSQATGFVANEPSLGGATSHGFASSPLELHSSAKSGERLEFQMHGFKGPHSYKWGYDTGKGHNRHFRFEERDGDGLVKGQYGYYDKHGKPHVINYHAHPHEGFHADEGDHSQF